VARHEAAVIGSDHSITIWQKSATRVALVRKATPDFAHDAGRKSRNTVVRYVSSHLARYRKKPYAQSNIKHPQALLAFFPLTFLMQLCLSFNVPRCCGQ
jgi:hypothetical protein